MKFYIAGKITGLVYEDAIKAFTDAESVIEKLGHQAVNPMKENGLDSDGKEYPWAEYMKRDIPHLLACDGIYLLPNWRDSKGATLEHYIAKELGMYIVYTSESGPYRELGVAERNAIHDATRNQGPDAYGLACKAAEETI